MLPPSPNIGRLEPDLSVRPVQRAAGLLEEVVEVLRITADPRVRRGADIADPIDVLAWGRELADGRRRGLEGREREIPDLQLLAAKHPHCDVEQRVPHLGSAEVVSDALVLGMLAPPREVATGRAADLHRRARLFE